MYGGLSNLDAASVEIPLVLYQAEQIVCGQLTVEVLRRWMAGVKRRELAEETGGLVAAGDVEKGAGKTERARELEAEEQGMEDGETLTASPTEGEVETEKARRDRLDAEVAPASLQAGGPAECA